MVLLGLRCCLSLGWLQGRGGVSCGLAAFLVRRKKCLGLAGWEKGRYSTCSLWLCCSLSACPCGLVGTRAWVAYPAQWGGVGCQRRSARLLVCDHDA